MISISLNLLRLDLWPKMCSILENVPCTLEKKVYSAFGWNVLKLSVSSSSPNVSFKACISLLIFYFDDLSLFVSGMLNSSSIIMLLSVSHFMSFSVCPKYWRAPMLGVFLLDWSLDRYVVSFMVSCTILYFKVYFVWYQDCYSCFLWFSIFMDYIFPSSHFQSICVLMSEVGFL